MTICYYKQNIDSSCYYFFPLHPPPPPHFTVTITFMTREIEKGKQKHITYTYTWVVLYVVSFLYKYEKKNICKNKNPDCIKLKRK